jgi:hypothetical protein
VTAADLGTRNYPLSARDNDVAFTFVLADDVKDVIERHGRPPLTGRDLAKLQMALFDFLFVDRAGVQP